MTDDGTAGLWSKVCPGVDCLTRGHLMVDREEGVKQASWCLWCGTGTSNEHEAGWGAGAAEDQKGSRP